MEFALIAGLALLFLISKTDTANLLQYKINAAWIDLKATDANKITLKVNFDLINNTPASAPLTSFNSVVYFNGLRLGSSFYDQPITINPGINKITLPIELPINTFAPGIAVAIQDAIINKSNPNFKIEGVFNTKLGSLKFDTVQQFKVF